MGGFLYLYNNNNQQTTIIMTKEEFYELLESYIEELTQDYAQKLRGIAEDLLKKVNEYIIDEEELEHFLTKHERHFHEQMESVIDDIREKLEQSSLNNNEIKEKTLSRIRESFSRIFERIVSSLKDLV